MKAKETVWLALIGGLTAIAASTTALAQSAQPTGACIIGETTCIDVPQEVCDAMGGVYLGDGTDCRDWSPLDAPGACCLADGTCVPDVTETECINVLMLAVHGRARTASAPANPTRRISAIALAHVACLAENAMINLPKCSATPKVVHSGETTSPALRSSTAG